MIKSARNYAFIDAQNLNLGMLKMDYKKFRRYLKEKATWMPILSCR